MYRAKTTSSKLGLVERGGWEGVSFPKVPKRGGGELGCFFNGEPNLIFLYYFNIFNRKFRGFFHSQLCL
jgi:hypothetical protein